MRMFKRLFGCADCDDKNLEIVNLNKIIQECRLELPLLHEELIKLKLQASDLRTQLDALKHEFVLPNQPPDISTLEKSE